MSNIDPPVSWEEQQYLDMKHERDALRDERDRLRAALVKCRRELWHCNEQLKYKGATEGFSVTEALSEAKAALTPAGQRWMERRAMP